MSEIAVNNSQNVNIVFSASRLGERIIAFAIDMVIKVAYLFLVYFILIFVFEFQKVVRTIDSFSIGALISLIVLPTLLYTLISESLMEGQTIGKKIMKIKVIKIDGFQAKFSDYLIRWILRLVDILILFGSIGLISIIISKKNQRLGGIASGTTVISLKNKVNISHTILENIQADYQPQFPQVVALSDNDIRIIKENYQKALRLKDKKMIHTLCYKIGEVTGIDLASVQIKSQIEFIAVILKDYNYYTGIEK